MVETSLHPRPCFYRFLAADSRKEGDALTYYDYQRALRSKKVEILQQRRAVRYEPGYKKPCAVHPAKMTRKVFQLKNKFPVPSGSPLIVKSPPLITEGVKTPVEPVNEQLINTSLGAEAFTTTAVEPSQSKTGISAARPSSATRENMMESTSVQAQTYRLPKISRKPRLVKSATARDSSLASISAVVSPRRPKTTASTRDSQVQTSLTQEGMLATEL